MTHEHASYHLRRLCKVFLSFTNTTEVESFLRDLCTPQEVQALTERWRVCTLLHDSALSYREIHRITGASLTTIGRVARFLREEHHNGYQNALTKRTEEHAS